MKEIVESNKLEESEKCGEKNRSLSFQYRKNGSLCLVLNRRKATAQGYETYRIENNKENVEYPISNKECKSWKKFSALNGRKATAQGNALCKECNADFFAPRWAANYGDLFTWGKTKGIEQIWVRFRVGPGMTINNEIPKTRTTKNRSLSFQYRKNGSLCATRLAVQNRLAHLITVQKSEGFAGSETLAGANNIYLN